MKKESKRYMKLNILVAENREILQKGLYAFFVADRRVATVYEASSVEELHNHLRNSAIDLIIINNTMVSDITLLPANRFVLLVPEFNLTTFLVAYNHGAKGYLLETSQAELFRTLLSLTPGGFLIEPSLTANIVEYITNDTRLLVKEELLTPREKEIMGLLRKNIDRNTIARQLNISRTTLKTHIKNISRKRTNKLA